MGRGHPDYFGQSIFLKYGIINNDGITQNVATTDWTTLSSISGKGKLGGGYVVFQSTVDVSKDYFRITVDGTVLTYTQAEDLDIFRAYKIPQLPFSLLSLTADLTTACIMIGENITYNESVVVEIKCATVDNRAVSGTIFYQDIS